MTDKFDGAGMADWREDALASRHQLHSKVQDDVTTESGRIGLVRI